MTQTAPSIHTRCLSSLTKVFADQPLTDTPFAKASALRNERFSFQVAYTSESHIKRLKVNLTSALRDQVSLYMVGLVPSELPCNEGHDEHVLRTTPGLYPDPLYPVTPEQTVESFTAFPGQWRSVWVTVQLNENIPPGFYPIHIHFASIDDEDLGSAMFELEVIDAFLPEQTLIHTEWFHTDGIANYYQVDVFSEPYWELVGKFVKTAVEGGMNMVLTPLFTPPLDTEIGGERRTVQLVDVDKEGDRYRFRFDKVTRWVNLCKQQGMKYFELSHLFTQWGAKHAPKIMATESGEYKQIFGWDTEATGPAYENFIDQFLPALKSYIYEHKLENQVYFHVSDEPQMRDLDQYQKSSRLLRKHVEQFPIIDALSDYSFYEQGIVKNPIPGSNHIEPFIENKVKPLWTYYCVAQNQLVSNRFFNMPSARNRIIGVQLYKFDVDGFLHWGYNFWNSQRSHTDVNPFLVTDALHSFASGDAFLVYPGAEGPIESIRMKVFFEALQDQRALALLESQIGKEAVIALLEDELQAPITFSEYPRDQEWLLAKREQINRAIQANLEK